MAQGEETCYILAHEKQSRTSGCTSGATETALRERLGHGFGAVGNTHCSKRVWTNAIRMGEGVAAAWGGGKKVKKLLESGNGGGNIYIGRTRK